MMTGTFLDEFPIGTKVLVKFLDGRKVVEQHVLTISSIIHHNRELYFVTFQEKEMKGIHTMFMGQLEEMKNDYEGTL